MIWGLVCINMCRYQRNFGSLKNCWIAVQSKWVNTDLMDDRRNFIDNMVFGDQRVSTKNEDGEQHSVQYFGKFIQLTAKLYT